MKKCDVCLWNDFKIVFLISILKLNINVLFVFYVLYIEDNFKLK